MKNKLFVFLLLVTVYSVSCTVHKTVTKPAPQLKLKKVEKGKQLELNSKWWENFNDKELNKTVEQVLQKNLTIVQSIARLKQMEAVAGIAKAGLMPSVNLDLNGKSTKYSYNTFNMFDATQTDKIDLYTATATVGYQVDLWKKVINGKKAAVYNYLASEKAAESVAMTVVSTTIDLYYSICEQQNAVKLIESQIEVLNSYLDLISSRAEKGLASLLEVLQQKQLLESTKNQLPLEQLKLKVLKNQLAVLLTQDPRQFDFTRENCEIPQISELSKKGISAQILLNRPDVKAAELSLLAADHQLAVAIADRFPNITLSASFGSQMDSPSTLFDRWFLSLSGDILTPIFNGGRLKNEVKRNKAVVYEKFKNWQYSILNAVKEVEDTLITEQKYKEVLSLTKSQVKLAKETLNQSLNRYENGLTDYLSVLSAQKTLYSLQREMLRKQRELVSNRVKLYLALGGDFSNYINNKNINIELEERK